MTDLRAQLQSSLGGTYGIERELGGGGMSRVFLATDKTLDRAVVVKVLSGEYSAGVSADRFRREIQVIARLQHPHVVPILSAGSADGALYYVMPFLGGETLRARLSRERVMSVPDATRVLRELLDALAFAHSHGVIHRDIKPENVLVEAGHAVVADFGIAKALKESSGLTSVGVSVGTPAYMAPEQAAADPAADHRVDLYAVGCVAYEMLCGEPPFVGSPQQVLKAHMVEEPKPLRERRSDVPEALAAIVMRALEKEPSARPQSAAEMLSSIEAVTTPGTQSTPATVARPASSRPSRRLVPFVLAALIVVGVVAWRTMRPKVIASAQSLMIAPFAVATGDTSLVRLSQNLVTTVSANLDGVGDIRTVDAVAALSHAKSKGALLSAADAIDIARTLGARSVLHGSLVSLGTSVRADAVLYDVGNGAQIGRLSVAGPSDGLTALTDSLSWGVLQAVWRGNPPTPNASSITTHSPVALREFLEGERQFGRQEYALASDAYRRAIAADSTFWFAYYRNRLVRGWIELPPDTMFSRKLREHYDELPERERLHMRLADSVMPQSMRVREYRALAQRYPNYAPAWVTYADYLLHHAIRSGHDVAESIEPWREVSRLMPGDISAADHILWACMSSANLECARDGFPRYDSLVRADSTPALFTRLQHRGFKLMLSPPSATLTDSIIRAGRRDSLLLPWTGSARLAFLVATDRPELMADWDRMQRETGRLTARKLNMPGLLSDWTMAMDELQRGEARNAGTLERLTPPQGVSPTGSLRMKTVADLLGLTTPDASTANTAIELAATPRLTVGQRVDAQWIAGFNALLRGDSAAFAARLSVLAADTSVHARIAGRSLRALRLGRAGQRAAAAESLLAVERPHGENAAKVWSAYAVDRLLAAQWLAETGRFAPADSLLRFVSGFAVTGTFEAASAIGAPALLVKSRIYEGLGKNDLAARHASAFLAAYDKAPASQKPLLDEARDRVARLRPADTRRGR